MDVKENRNDACCRYTAGGSNISQVEAEQQRTAHRDGARQQCDLHNQGASPDSMFKGSRLPRSQKKLLGRLLYREKKRQRRPEERRRRRQKHKEEIFRGLTTDEERTEAMVAYKARLLKEKEEAKAHAEACMKEGLRICFNCSFDDSMHDKELRSLGKQLFTCYHYARKATDIKLQLHFSSFKEESRCRDICETLYAAKSWQVHRHDEPYWECFDRDEMIVLSPDASEELMCIDSSKVYIIGGLVDRTISKGDSFAQAAARNIECRRLPFKRFLPDQQRLVLNLTSVLEAIVGYLRTEDWLVSLKAVIPSRMQGIGGRKRDRLKQKRERVKSLMQADSSFADAVARRRSRESAWCKGRAACKVDDALDSDFAITEMETLAQSDWRETKNECASRTDEVTCNPLLNE